ncbi:MAG: DUF3426 domain-containing protein [Burkholderiales bacterium]
MKLITRCPECRTAFRVHENQLAARQGKVRCGACGFIFDAFASLVEVIQEDPRRPQQPAAIARVANEPALQMSSRTVGGGPSLSLGAATMWPGMTGSARHSQTLAFESKPASRDPGSSMQSNSVGVPAALAPGSLQRPAEYASQPFDFGQESVDPGPPIKWKIGAALLALLLAIQAVYSFRGMIAATFPETRPLITGICRILACSVPIPRHAEQLILEASDLQFEPGDRLTLTATIRNRAGFGQAYPSLLLTLSDQRNRPIARRVIHPKEYLGLDPAGAEMVSAGGILNARVSIDGAALGAAGYEVMVFYP